MKKYIHLLYVFPCVLEVLVPPLGLCFSSSCPSFLRCL